MRTASKPTALLLMNMGGPHNLQEVGPFLHRLFSDKDLIPLPLQSQMAPWIARRRTPKIVQQYAEIGGGSPIRMWTEKQGELLAKRMDELSPVTAPHKSYIAFRYAPPLTDETLMEMQKDGVSRAIAMTLYPQYSCSTTGSSLNELYKCIKNQDPNNKIKWSVIDRWHSDDGLINVFSKKIQQSLNEYPKDERDKVVLLFSAHSLPMSVVNRGDPYPGEVAATVSRIMHNLGHSNPYRIVWQSKVGPAAWLGPRTDEAIQGYAQKGVKNVLLVPIAFVSDHIETLYELDIEYAHLAKENGIGFKRVESLNADPLFIEAMANIVSKHVAEPKLSKQLLLRCPSCTNGKCMVTKEFFAEQHAFA